MKDIDRTIAAMTAPTSDQAWGFTADHKAWLEDFRRQHGRAPRILGIGNIANNGYRNALALRAVGVECDVLTYGYFHIMGCPEWEDAEFDATGLDPTTPDWSTVDLKGYERPRWFAQGRLGTSIDYLISFREGAPDCEALWRKMNQERNAGGEGEDTTVYSEPLTNAQMRGAAEELALEFSLRFPRRRDQLDVDDLLTSDSFALPRLLMADSVRVRRMLDLYDAVIGYSIDGLWSMLVGDDRYVAFEHGTIRSLPFERSLLGQICALTYAMAQDVLITNCDNVIAAERMALPSYRFTPHAILETWRDPPIEDLRRSLLEEHQSDFLVFHSARQHWSDARNPNWEKGNDILIEAFARFLDKRPSALLVMIEWGVSVEASKALVESLGIVDRVVWLPPMPIRQMTAYIAASDVLADQFTIGAWGGIMPIGMLVGTPVMIYLNEAVHRWCFPEMPPIVNAATPDAVLEGLLGLLDPVAARALGQAGRDWYDRYHSLEVVAGRLTDSLQLSIPQDEFAGRTPPEAIRNFGRRMTNRVATTDSLSRGVFERVAEQSADIGDLERLYGPNDVVCYEYWSNAGASVQVGTKGATVITPASAWHYAAGVNLDFDAIDLQNKPTWIRLRIAEVVGEMSVCLYRSDTDAVIAETSIPSRQSIQDIVLPASDPLANLLLLRTGSQDAAATATVLSLEILVDHRPWGLAADQHGRLS